ncbi:MAG: hypothetical protein ACQKBU_08030, partial [Verrucomicrobiales bacterium]
AEMQSQLRALEGPANGISKQIGKEEELQEIASIYTDADADRVFWLDLYAELNEAFASEAVWITDMSPIAGYDPLAERPSEGEEVVKGEFASSTYGDTALEVVEYTPVPTRKPRRGDPPIEPVPAPINALRLKGYWLDNPNNQNIVFKLLGKLKENASNGSSHFTFTIGEGEDSVELEQNQLAPTVEMAPVEGEFAAPFELILPLAKPVSYR